jgi:hypothetical protein
MGRSLEGIANGQIIQYGNLLLGSSGSTSGGSIFSYDPTQTNVDLAITPIYNFTGTDGNVGTGLTQVPVGSNVLYGTTQYGGVYDPLNGAGAGTVYQYQFPTINPPVITRICPNGGGYGTPVVVQGTNLQYSTIARFDSVNNGGINPTGSDTIEYLPVGQLSLSYDTVSTNLTLNLPTPTVTPGKGDMNKGTFSLSGPGGSSGTVPFRWVP